MDDVVSKSSSVNAGSIGGTSCEGERSRGVYEASGGGRKWKADTRGCLEEVAT